MKDIDRLLHAWQTGRIESVAYGGDVVSFYLAGERFDGEVRSYLARPGTVADRVRLARLCFPFEPDPTWYEVKMQTVQLFNLHFSARRWRQLRSEAGLAYLPNRPSGRPKNQTSVLR